MALSDDAISSLVALHVRGYLLFVFCVYPDPQATPDPFSSGCGQYSIHGFNRSLAKSLICRPQLDGVTTFVQLKTLSDRQSLDASQGSVALHIVSCSAQGRRPQQKDLSRLVYATPLSPSAPPIVIWRRACIRPGVKHMMSQPICIPCRPGGEAVYSLGYAKTPHGSPLGIWVSYHDSGNRAFLGWPSSSTRES